MGILLFLTCRQQTNHIQKDSDDVGGAQFILYFNDLHRKLGEWYFQWVWKFNHLKWTF